MLNVLFSIRLGNWGAGKGVLLHRACRGVCVPPSPSPGPLPLPLPVRVFSFEDVRSRLVTDFFRLRAVSVAAIDSCLLGVLIRGASFCADLRRHVGGSVPEFPAEP